MEKGDYQGERSLSARRARCYLRSSTCSFDSSSSVLTINDQSPGLGKAIVFGGYNSSVPTALPGVGLAGYTYYADAFLYCHTTGAWKQILTRGFPTYRAQAHVVADPASGRTFLFGGYTNTDYIPSRRTHISRSFGDLWELRIDVDGGHFEGVDLDEEKRTARAGPWQRCFTCGGSGPWKRCSGSLVGKEFRMVSHILSAFSRCMQWPSILLRPSLLERRMEGAQADARLPKDSLRPRGRILHWISCHFLASKKIGLHDAQEARLCKWPGLWRTCPQNEAVTAQQYCLQQA
jgi:hypothetical protein